MNLCLHMGNVLDSNGYCVIMSTSVQQSNLIFDQIDQIPSSVISGEFHSAVDPFWISKMYNMERSRPYQWVVKRLMDRVFSAIILALISPLLLLIAIAIKIDSRGPVLFKQMRIGKNGKEFKMYKFRSMHLDAENQLKEVLQNNETNHGMFKMFDDPRVTRVGNILRRFSFDELPQLFNVLKGEMSLVGPRPPIRRELEHYENWHYIRFASIPGLTGMWQTHGRSLIKNFDDVVALDSYYIKNWNILLDCSLLLKTIPVVVFAKGAA